MLCFFSVVAVFAGTVRAINVIANAVVHVMLLKPPELGI